MTVARKNVVDTSSPGFYHCTNRCVRRAFLCGYDEVTGNNYEHRKDFFEQEMFRLCQYFAVDIYAHSVMDNHYHIVLYLKPKAPLSWSDEMVAERWLNATGGKLNLPQNANSKRQRKKAIMNSPERLKECRQRLGSLSWFMKQLNETVARKCNAEDGCTGRFWEGRFTSQAILDEASLLSCMAYVDLNPVRAKITNMLRKSKYTGIKLRLDSLNEKGIKKRQKLKPLNTNTVGPPLSITLEDYIALVEWVGYAVRYPGRGHLPKNVKTMLVQLNLQPNHWLSQVQHLEKGFTYFIGPADKIRAKAKQLKKRYLRGISAANSLFCTTP